MGNLDSARAALLNMEVFAEGEDLKRVRVVINALEHAAAETAALREDVARLRGALTTIEWEANRMNGGLVHMKRCIAAQSRAALEPPAVS